MTFEPQVIHMTVSENETIQMTISDARTIQMGVGSCVRMGEMLEHYVGDVTVTPTQETQILSTADLVLDSNITINPIPSNYGRITWNGSTLTVS